MILKQVHIRGSSRNGCKIIGNGNADTITISTVNCILENLTIEQIDTKNGGAISVSSGYTTLRNVTATSFTISAVQAFGDSTLTLSDCTFTGSFNPSLLISDHASVRASSTTLSSSQTFGIMLSESSTADLFGCTISDNYGFGGQVTDSANLHLTDCTVRSNNAGLNTSSTGRVVLERCTISDHIENPALHISGSGNVVMSQCKFARNTLGAVKCFQGGHLQSSQCTFEDCEKNVMVIAHDDAEYESIGDTFTGPCIAAVAAFVGGSIKLENLTVRGVPSAAVLAYAQGKVTVNGGNVSNAGSGAFQARERSELHISDLTVSHSEGVAALITDGAFGIIERCFFVNGQVALEVMDVSSDLTFKDCEFSQNAIAGANVHGQMTSPNFVRCKFNGNGQVGIDVSEGAAPAFEGCDFECCGEAAVNAQATTRPKFMRCRFINAGKVGVSLAGTTATFENCKVKGAGQAGLAISAGDKTSFTGCKIHKNKALGAQIHMQGTAPTFNECSFRKQTGSVAMIVLNGADVEIENTKFENSLQPHIEIRDGAVVKLKKCDVGPAEKGTGLQIHSGGTLLMRETVIRDNSKVGLVVAAEGTVKMFNSEVKNCGMCGIMTTGSAKLNLDECKIEDNGQFAMQIQSGKVSFKNCVFKNHQSFGVVINAGAEVDYSDNTFENCGNKDIYLNTN